MFTVEELLNTLNYYEIHTHLLNCIEASEEIKHKAWEDYYNYQKALSERVSCVFSLNDLICNIYWCNRVDEKDRLQVLIKILNAMNIGVE